MATGQQTPNKPGQDALVQGTLFPLGFSPSVTDFGEALNLIAELQKGRPSFSAETRSQADLFHWIAVERAESDCTDLFCSQDKGLQICAFSSSGYERRVQPADRDSLIDYDPETSLLLLRDNAANPLFLGLIGHVALRQLMTEYQGHTDLRTEKDRRFQHTYPFAIALLETVLLRGNFRAPLISEFSKIKENANTNNVRWSVQDLLRKLELSATWAGGEQEKQARAAFIADLVCAYLGGWRRAEVLS